MRDARGFAIVLMAGLTACDGGSGPRMTHVYVRLTDAPNPAITSASATISSVYLIGADGTSRVTITTTSKEYELYPALSGITVALGDKITQAGDYAQLRLVVEKATVLLAGETEPRDLKVPSGEQTGIKVEFGGPIHLAAAQATLVVDFDVANSFVVTGTTPPLSVLFKPVLHGTMVQ